MEVRQPRRHWLRLNLRGDAKAQHCLIRVAAEFWRSAEFVLLIILWMSDATSLLVETTHILTSN